MEQLDFMTAEEVSALLRVSQQHVCRLAKRGEFPGIKLGTLWRFNRPDVLAWIKARSNAA